MFAALSKIYECLGRCVLTLKSKKGEIKIMKKIRLYNDDCFSRMKKIKSNSVDMIITDPPYGITQNKWDADIDLKLMWKEFNRVVKDNGAIIITAAQPFTSTLILSNVKDFKYDVIWEKTICSGQLNVKKQPLRAHESVCIFYKKQPIYNEQQTWGKPYSINRKADYVDGNYGKQKESSKENDGFRHAKSVIKISNPRVKGGHPTQKPVPLFEHFIKCFTNENELVLDPFMGSGTAAEACANLNRKFIGIELDKKYFQMAKERIING